MRVRCFSRNAPRMPGTEFSAKEVATSTGHGSNQRPSASRERILQLCDRSVPLLESRRTEGERRYTEEERIGRGKYRHLVNTCTSRAGPSRVREGCLSSSSSSMFFFLSLSFSFTFVHAYRYVAMYSTRFIPSFSFPSPPLPSENSQARGVASIYLSIDSESMIFHRPGIRIFFSDRSRN